MTTITAPSKSFLFGLVKDYLDQQPDGLGFAIGLIGPDFFYQWHFGNLKNQFGADLTFDEDTPFEIASISKTFTATLYAASSYYASPSNTLASYIAPTGPLPISASLSGITLDSLMSYSSGLPADNDGDGADTPTYLPQPYCWPAMFSYLATSPPALGSGYNYSNLAFALMAAVLSGSPVEGSTFTSAIGTTILEPLGMANTVFFENVDLNTLPLGYDYSSDADTPTAYAPGWPLFPAYYGAGGLVSTTRDLLKWLSFNMGRRKVAGLSSVLAVTQAPATNVTWGDTQLGLGWFISPGANGGAATVWKDGDLDGFSSYIAFLQSDNPGTDPSQAGAFVLVNAEGLTDSQGNELTATVANDILLQMQGISPPADKSVYPSRKRRAAARS